MLAALAVLAAGASAASLCSNPLAIDDTALGAYFRKVEAVPDADQRGVAGEGVVARPSFDPQREFTASQGQPSWWTGPLDRPSVYVGARGPYGHELDAGLTWDRIYRADGSATDDFAFRPFWRDTDAQGEAWHNPPIGHPFYVLPGESFTMQLQLLTDDSFALEIAAGVRRYYVRIAHRGFPLKGARSFKRVNSIDQFRVVGGARAGNEGETILPTNTRAEGGRWSAVDLLGADGRRLPLAGALCRVVVGGDSSFYRDRIFVVSGAAANGAERVDIFPLPR